jgi:zinc protease
MVHAKVAKYSLDNGLTILVVPQHAVPRVTVEVMYNVGSKDELSGEKGKAHLLEHMIFKGTETMSESDINMISYKLSGIINAFTSYDYTGYWFDLPTANWKEALPMLADCMKNCTFKQELLNSEMKAVIQELKMYKDSSISSLVEAMMTSIFPDHPYHYPIIGYKQELWDMKSEDLHTFYKKHYVPNNATLVVVGDVDPDDVYNEAKKLFGHIPADTTYKKKEFFHNHDLAATSVTLQRDINQPLFLAAYNVPGARSKQDFVLNLAAWVIGQGRGSVLYQRLVEQEQLATDVGAFSYDLFDYGIFFIQVIPKDEQSIDRIREVVQEELSKLAANGITKKQVDRAVKNTKVGHLSLFESNQRLASDLATAYLATGDENFLFNYVDDDATDLAERIQALIARYMRESVMHTGKVVGLSDGERARWLELQSESDAVDAKILEGKERASGIEPGVKVLEVEPNPAVDFDYPKSETFTLKNGIKVLFHQDKRLPKVSLVLSLKAKYYYDSNDKAGLNNFVTEMMLEGTSKYNTRELADIIEQNGMSLNVFPGRLHLGTLADDFVGGCELAAHILKEANFPADALSKVRQRLLNDVKYEQDSPKSVGIRAVREAIYKGHPYSKNATGTMESISSITREDILEGYKKTISHDGAKIAVVGDIGRDELEKCLNKTFGDWSGSQIVDMEFPELHKLEPGTVKRPMNRDQVVLMFAAPSINRLDHDYDKLLLFDQIFGGGALNSMNSRLFALRERSGLFYTVRGSLTAGSDEQPGMVYVMAIVSRDNLKEAEDAIGSTIDKAIDTITEQELVEAKNAVSSGLTGKFSSNAKIAETMLFVDRFDFDKDYFDKRAGQLEGITVDEVKTAVKRVLSTDRMIRVHVGRV